MATHSKQYLEKRIRQELTKAARQHKFLAISERREGRFRLRCPNPDHKSGRERTPSLWLNVSASSKYFFRFKCFGCGFSGQWPKLAKLIHCDPIVTKNMQDDIRDSVYDEEAVRLFDKHTDQYLLGVNTTVMPDGLLWPDYMDWRTIKGEVVAAVNGIIFIDPVIKADMLGFPVVAPDGSLEGHVKANIIPKKGVNYFNAEGMASTKCLLFADVATEMIHELHKLDPQQKYARLAFISEGPRDALTPLQFGYPSVCNLGAGNSWTSYKVNLLLAMGIDLLIVCMDGDQPGLDAAKKIEADACDILHVHSITFPAHTVMDKGLPKLEKLKDLSDLNKVTVQQIVAEACAAYGKSPPPAYSWSTRSYVH